MKKVFLILSIAVLAALAPPARAVQVDVVIQVLDAKGNPVADAAVDVYDETTGGTLYGPHFTDANGDAVFALESTHAFSAYAAGAAGTQDGDATFSRPTEGSVVLVTIKPVGCGIGERQATVRDEAKKKAKAAKAARSGSEGDR